MVPSIEVGLVGLPSSLDAAVADVLDISLDRIIHLEIDEVSGFLKRFGHPSGRVLLVASNCFTSDEEVSALILTAIQDPMLQIVLCQTTATDETVSPLAKSPAVHLVEYDDHRGIDELKHHLYTIKQTLDALWLNTKIADVMAFCESGDVEESDHSARMTRFLEKLVMLIPASSVSVYTLDSNGADFRIEFKSGRGLPVSIPRKVVGHLTTKEFWTYQFPHKLQAWFLAHGGSKFGLMSVFNLQMVPGIVVYTFQGSPSTYPLVPFCQAASREVFHLLRRRQLRTRFDCLRDLERISNLSNEKKNLVLAVIERLMKHFHVKALSVVEKEKEADGSMIFKKTFRHWEYTDEDWFPAAKGFAYYCVTHEQALLINRTDFSTSTPYGEGLAFEPYDLRLGTGKPVRIETIVAPNTIKNEASLMYFPLKHSEEILGALKVGDFEKPNAFNLHHLRDLAVFSDFVATTLWNLKQVGSLRKQIDSLKLQDRMVKSAETLWFYRDISQGVFHQATNHLARLFTNLQAAQMITEKKELEIAELRGIIAKNLNLARIAKDLIGEAQKRGTTLVPSPQKGLLIRDVLRPAFEYAQRKIEEDPAQIKVRHLFGKKDFAVFLDKELAKESLINLLNNSIWAVKANTAQTKKSVIIIVREANDGKFINVLIRDTGIGIEPDVVPTLFSRFVTTRDDSGGTGLGLYFAKLIVEGFGGSIRIVKTYPGKGTTILIKFPLAEARK